MEFRLNVQSKWAHVLNRLQEELLEIPGSKKSPINWSYVIQMVPPERINSLNLTLSLSVLPDTCVWTSCFFLEDMTAGVISVCCLNLEHPNSETYKSWGMVKITLIHLIEMNLKLPRKLEKKQVTTNLTIANLIKNVCEKCHFYIVKDDKVSNFKPHYILSLSRGLRA